MNYVQLLEEVKEEVIRFYELNIDDGYSYHDIDHTTDVVEHAAEIARHYNLGDREFFIVCTAAWFHDVGYYMGGSTEHEKRGTEMAEAFLLAKAVDPTVIAEVKQAIMATCLPQTPTH